ncbi:MAG: MATE family efflux transporter [Desulfopila sp.]
MQRQSRYPYSEVLRVCLPLVLGMSATTAMEFTDRAFLSNYSIEAISAAIPASISAFLFMAFFGGIGNYGGVFIAQYYGSGAMDRIGRVLWQSIWLCLFASVVFWLLAFFASEPLFAFAGHAPAVRILEERYFTILCMGGGLQVAATVLATFFTGRGITRPVMLITTISVAINIPLDYALIYGRWGLPELGIEGAGIATVSAWGVSCLLFAALIFTRDHDRRFGVYQNRGFDGKLFRRLLRYGIPGSLQFTLDILAFTLFILLVGRIGTRELAATNIVLAINALAFMPSMGVSQGISVMVGQALGRTRPVEAKGAVASAARLLLLYILVVDLGFIFFPELVLQPFLHAVPAESVEQITALCVDLLQVVAAYLFMDALYMIYSGALKGAGDTRFLMISVGITSLTVLVVPVYFGITRFGMGVIGAWLWVLVFVIVLFTLSAARYFGGKWQKMLVIEQEAGKADDDTT